MGNDFSDSASKLGENIRLNEIDAVSRCGFYCYLLGTLMDPRVLERCPDRTLQHVLVHNYTI